MNWRLALIAYCSFALCQEVLFAQVGLTEATTQIALPVIQCAQVRGESKSLKLPAGSAIYIYGMATGGAHDSGPFSECAVALPLKNQKGFIAAQLAVCTVPTNQFRTPCAYYVIGGCGVADYSHLSAFYVETDGIKAGSVLANFTLRAPALVVIFGLAANQDDLTFDGLPGLTIDAPVPALRHPIAACIGHAVSEPGTYTIHQVSHATSPNRKPDSQVSFLGVFVFCNSPNAVTSTDRFLNLPTAIADPGRTLVAAHNGTTVVLLSNISDGGISGPVWVCAGALVMLVLVGTVLAAIAVTRKNKRIRRI